MYKIYNKNIKKYEYIHAYTYTHICTCMCVYIYAKWKIQSLLDGISEKAKFCQLNKDNPSYLKRQARFRRDYFCSVTKSCPTWIEAWPDFPVLHYLPELAQIHVHWVGDAIQPSHCLSSPSPPVLNLSQHRGLFQWVSSSHQVAKVLELQLQHLSYQWIFRTDFL